MLIQKLFDNQFSTDEIIKFINDEDCYICLSPKSIVRDYDSNKIKIITPIKKVPSLRCLKCLSVYYFYIQNPFDEEVFYKIHLIRLFGDKYYFDVVRETIFSDQYKIYVQNIKTYEYLFEFSINNMNSTDLFKLFSRIDKLILLK